MRLFKIYILFYRPQRSCGKVTGVCHSVHGGMYPRMHWGRHPLPPGQTPLWADNLPWADTPLADIPLGRHPPGRHLPPTATAADDMHPTGMHSCLITL